MTLTDTGDAEVFVELFVGFALAMAAGLLCIYMVLVLLFNDFVQPLTILTALPLSSAVRSSRCCSTSTACRCRR